LVFLTNRQSAAARGAAISPRALLRRLNLDSPAHRAAAIALMIRLGNAALAYVAQVLLARLMGQFEYGVFAYTWAWFVVFGALATLGFGESTVRFVPELRERGEVGHLCGFVRFAPLAIVAGSILTAAILIVALPFAGSIIGAPYVLPMMLMAISLPFACLQSFFEGIGRCYGWTVPALLPIYILRHGLLLAFMIAAVAFGFQASAATALICLALTVTVSLAAQALAILPKLARTLPPNPRRYRPSEWVRGAMPFALLHGAANFLSFADVVVLSFFVGPNEIATYFAATRIIHVVNLVPYAATVGTAHLFAAANARGDRAELQRLCRHVALTTFAIAFLAVAALLILGKLLLGMFGDGFEAGFLPLAILAGGIVVGLAAGPAEDVLNMTGHGSLSASTYLAIIGVNVALCAALIGPFGIAGAAAASAGAMTARALWLWRAAQRRIGVDTSVAAALAATLGNCRASQRAAPAE
jgi:O-antigen/teichoic acid export membrane protein